ncbi:MAG: GNAT family N-acetyltransferase [Chitinophagaceae bacterium]|nr:GNAT family N-acetyltransferase [Chitinophagaceae bacterium]
MAHWIDPRTKLTGHCVDLLPLTQNHFVELEVVAHDKRIWEHYVYDGSNADTFKNIFNSALIDKEKGNQFPFVIFHKQVQRIIGSTRFLDIQLKHKKLEIGSTWIHPDYWATEVNFECKLLLLEFCFHNLKAVRVQLKTDENNLRSRRAIEKIGGRFEGIIRHDMIRDNQTKRNSACYSIIDDEWSKVKLKLIARLEEKRVARK